jgi:hypothetical protein
MTQPYPGKVYLGTLMDGAPAVRVCQGGICRLLPLRLELRNPGLSGVDWGDHGAGADQLCLAILCDALRDDARALAIHKRLTDVWASGLPSDRAWSLRYDDLELLIAALEDRQAAKEGLL